MVLLDIQVAGITDRPEVFDRATGEPIAWEHLRSYGLALSRHYLHPETKFLDGEDTDQGTLSRRHVEVWAVSAIGKEADNLDEREAFGEGDDPISYGVAVEGRRKLVADLEAMQAEFGISDRTLIAQAKVSRRTLAALRNGGRVAMRSMLAVITALENGARNKRRQQVIDVDGLRSPYSFAMKSVSAIRYTGRGHYIIMRAGPVVSFGIR